MKSVDAPRWSPPPVVGPDALHGSALAADPAVDAPVVSAARTQS